MFDDGVITPTPPSHIWMDAGEGVLRDLLASKAGFADTFTLRLYARLILEDQSSLLSLGSILDKRGLTSICASQEKGEVARKARLTLFVSSARSLAVCDLSDATARAACCWLGLRRLTITLLASEQL